MLRRFFPGGGTRVLELGAGSGNVMAYLASKGMSVDGADIYDEALRYIAGLGGMAIKYDLRDDPSAAGDVNSLKEAYDAVIMADVIEHLDDPAPALRHAGYFCRKGGVMIITVPAMQELWSHYDVACGHKKRYDMSSLRSVIKDAEMDCLSIRSIFFVVAIALFARRRTIKASSATDEELIAREFDINPFTNSLFRFICGIEFLAGKILDFPIGSSLVAVVKKHAK
jgi:SAM-dependent methyltransferase